jgi:hypothetical protein
MIASAILLVNHPVLANGSDLDGGDWSISQSSISGSSFSIMGESSSSVSTDTDGEPVNMMMVSLARADLGQPYILRIAASLNDYPAKLTQATIKLNGKVVKTVTNTALELNLSPLLKNGRNVVEISASSLAAEATITTRLIGANANIHNQSAGYGSSKQQLIVNVE